MNVACFLQVIALSIAKRAWVLQIRLMDDGRKNDGYKRTFYIPKVSNPETSVSAREYGMSELIVIA